MFIEAFIAAIIIGYILGGRLKNLENWDVKGLYLVLIGFGIEAVLHYLTVKGIISIGIITYVFNFIMYLMIFAFIVLNRKNVYIVTMGIGFVLNALVIFLNGGVMPVGQHAITAASLSQNIASEGLYSVADNTTKLAFLGDVITFKPLGRIAFSIGDVISCIGFSLLIITSMKLKPEKMK